MATKITYEFFGNDFKYEIIEETEDRRALFKAKQFAIVHGGIKAIVVKTESGNFRRAYHLFHEDTNGDFEQFYEDWKVKEAAKELKEISSNPTVRQYAEEILKMFEKK